MRISNLVYKSFNASLLLLVCGLAGMTGAQTAQKSSAPARQEKRQRATVELPEEKMPQPVARRSELYCGGFIQSEPVQVSMEIVGGEQEQEKHVYGQGDYVYLDAGAQQGMQVGQQFAIIRPRGQFKSRWSNKKGSLGDYVQELGLLRVVRVKDRISVALITESCETVLMGDLLSSIPQRVAPPQRAETGPLDRFSDPSGKQQGRIVLARDSREVVSKDHVVFIDLGTEDNIKAGDYFTIYRAVASGNLTNQGDEELAANTRDGFESIHYRGGKFSNKAQRLKDPNASSSGSTVKTTEIRRSRPPMPHKIVGELVVLNVQARTATAVITRVAQEIHTGDLIELQ